MSESKAKILCNTCFKNKKTMFRCTRCRSVYYCSVECQKKDWLVSHKHLCKKRIQNRTTSKNNNEKITTEKKCGLCGSTKNLCKTECCNQWICDDEEDYVLFSYARNSCSRNHRKYTLCSYHDGEGHSGNWKDCEECKKSFSDDMSSYVYYATNEYNFEKLENIPDYDDVLCTDCGAVIKLGREGHTQQYGKYWCENCTIKQKLY